jgi:predicted CoA-substrate-specific enzyme activase
MVTAGIDCGAKTVKVVVLEDGRILGKSLVPAGVDTAWAAESAYHEALKKAGLKRRDVRRVCATGSGKLQAAFRNEEVTEVGADARGAVHLFPKARTVVDVGVEEGRAIRVDERGKVVDFAINERCAAGAGAFVEAMARALEVKLEEMGPLSLQSGKAVPMNAQCAVFAESELVSLVHAKTPKPDMARAIHDAIADRIVSMVRRVGMEPEVVLIGGVARNVGFVESLNRDLETEVRLPEEPEFVGALGAALVAAK